MSVTTTTSLFQYAIASLGQAFSPACAIQNASDFVLTYTDPTSLADTVLTLNTDYFVTGTFTAGVCAAPTVTLEGAGLHYAVGGNLTIQRKNPLTQPTVYVDGQKYLAATTNNALDWLCYSIQELNDLLARCLQVPPSNAALSPIPLAARKSMVLGFDSNGVPTLYPLTSPAGGNVVGPATAGADGNIPLFSGVTGKVLKDSGQTLAQMFQNQLAVGYSASLDIENLLGPLALKAVSYAQGGSVPLAFDIGNFADFVLESPVTTLSLSPSPAGSSGVQLGRFQFLFIHNTTGGDVTMTYNSSWVVNGTLPGTLANNATLSLLLFCAGGTESSIRCTVL